MPVNDIVVVVHFSNGRSARDAGGFDPTLICLLSPGLSEGGSLSVRAACVVASKDTDRCVCVCVHLRWR